MVSYSTIKTTIICGYIYPNRNITASATLTQETYTTVGVWLANMGVSTADVGVWLADWGVRC